MINLSAPATEQAASFNDTKKRIFDAASTAFADNGFKATTTRDIADRADVNIASLHYHFGSKEDLYAFVIKYWLEVAFADFPYTRLGDRTIPVRERFITFIQATIDNMFGRPEAISFPRLFAREALADITPAFDSLIRGAVEPNTRILKELIAELTAGCLTEQELDYYTASTIGLCLFYDINQGVLPSIFRVSVETADEITALADHVTTYSLAALEMAIRKSN